MNRIIFLLLSLNAMASCFMIDHTSASPRIRDSRIFVATAEAETVTETKTSAPRSVRGKPVIEKINSEKQYRDFLARDDRLTMIKFYAPYCKSCQKFGMQFERIGREIGELSMRNSDGTETVVREGEIRMAEIEYGANKELCKRLGIKKLPSVHFYSQGKLVDGFPCGPRKISMLLEKLMTYRAMSLAELDFEADMNRGISLGKSVVESLKWEYDNRPARTNSPVVR